VGDATALRMTVPFQPVDNCGFYDDLLIKRQTLLDGGGATVATTYQFQHAAGIIHCIRRRSRDAMTSAYQ